MLYAVAILCFIGGDGCAVFSDRAGPVRGMEACAERVAAIRPYAEHTAALMSRLSGGPVAVSLSCVPPAALGSLAGDREI